MHRDKAFEDLISLQILEKIKVDDGTDKNIVTGIRLEREYWWMTSLFTVFPIGLNDKVKHFGMLPQMSL